MKGLRRSAMADTYTIPTNLNEPKSGTNFLKKQDFWSKGRREEKVGQWQILDHKSGLPL